MNGQILFSLSNIYGGLESIWLDSWMVRMVGHAKCVLESCKVIWHHVRGRGGEYCHYISSAIIKPYWILTHFFTRCSYWKIYVVKFIMTLTYVYQNLFCIIKIIIFLVFMSWSLCYCWTKCYLIFLSVWNHRSTCTVLLFMYSW